MKNKFLSLITGKLSREEILQLKKERDVFIEYVVADIISRYKLGDEGKKKEMILALEYYVRKRIPESFILFKIEYPESKITIKLAKAWEKKIIRKIKQYKEMSRLIFV